MKINEVYIGNINDLYETTLSREDTGIEDKYAGLRNFGKDFISIYQKSFVSFYISEITMIEALVMKSFASSMVVSDALEFNDYDDDKLKAILMSTVKMCEDSDIKIIPDKLLLPADMVHLNIVAIFSGSQLASILSMYPASIFSKLEKDGKMPTSLPMDGDDLEIVKNCLIEALMVNFYQHLVQEFSNYDICTESIHHSKYYSKVWDEKPVQMINISSPLKQASPIDYDNFVEDINEAKEFKNFVNDKSFHISSDEYMKLCTVDIAIHSSLATYIELIMKLPKGIINDHQPYRLLFNENESVIFPSEWNSYEKRIENRKSIIENRIQMEIESDRKNGKSVYSNNNLNEENTIVNRRIAGCSLKKFCMIPLYRPINYTMHLSLYDINYVLGDFYMHEYAKIEDTNTFVSNEINNIFKLIIQIGHIAKKYLG